MGLIERSTDLFTSGLGGIGHGCNTRGVMGAGIAQQFSRRYPQMVELYRSYCADGSFTVGSVMAWRAGPDLLVYNLATQQRPGPHAELDAIGTCVTKMLAHAARAELVAVGIPRIGCGIGGLRYEQVRPVLQAAAAPFGVDLVVCTPHLV